MKPACYEQLIVWKEAHQLCLVVYEKTKMFPKDERFALVNQMRRSSASVPTNIVEGNGKRSVPQKLHFLEIAETSLDELDYQLLLSRDLNYINSSECEGLRENVRRVQYLLSQLRLGIERHAQKL